MTNLGSSIEILGSPAIADEEQELNFLKMITGQEVKNVISGLGTSEDNDLASLYNHLVRYRNHIATNPDYIAQYQDPKQALEMLDYALKNWNTPQRQQVLDSLAEMEDQLIASGQLTLSGIDGELGGFFKKVATGIKKAAQGVKGAIKDATKAVVTVTATPAREAFKVSMRLNAFGIADKLAYGYLSDYEVSKADLEPGDVKAVRDVLNKVIALFEKMGGKKEHLKDAILSGQRANFASKLVASNAPAQKPSPVAQKPIGVKPSPAKPAVKSSAIKKSLKGFGAASNVSVVQVKYQHMPKYAWKTGESVDETYRRHKDYLVNGYPIQWKSLNEKQKLANFNAVNNTVKNYESKHRIAPTQAKAMTPVVASKPTIAVKPNPAVTAKAPPAVVTKPAMLQSKTPEQTNVIFSQINNWLKVVDFEKLKNKAALPPLARESVKFDLLSAFNNNINNISALLAYAYYDSDQVKNENIDQAEWNKLLIARKNIENLAFSKYKIAPADIKKAVVAGRYKKPATLSGLGGDDNDGILKKISEWLKNIKIRRKAKQEAKQEFIDSGGTAKEWRESGKDEFKQEYADVMPDFDINVNPEDLITLIPDNAIKEATVSKNKPDMETENENGGIKQMLIKYKKPIIIAAGTLAALGIGYAFWKNNKKKVIKTTTVKKGLSGHTNRKSAVKKARSIKKPIKLT